MDLIYKKEAVSEVTSFFVTRVNEPVLDTNWHFHEEYELIYIMEGSGVRLVGDNLSNFHAGELVLVGSNIPHLWRTAKDAAAVDRIIVKFDSRPGNVDIFSLPEFGAIKNLLAASDHCISFGPITKEAVHDDILALTRAADAEKWIRLLKILQTLATSQDTRSLTGPYMKKSISSPDQDRLSKVIAYISANYNQNITLEDVADVASMTIQSFCRFFKRRTNKTFVQFLNEFRLGKACVLLVENKMDINEVGYYLGYNSPTNFNRVFKKHYACTPMQYRRRYTQIGADEATLAQC